MAFPTLSINPSVRDWTEEKAFDPTIRSRSEGGYVKTRARCTRIPRKWHMVYDALSKTDKETLEEYEDDQQVGAGSFNWTNPLNSTTYSVRFAGPVKYTMMGNVNFWTVAIDLEEV